VKRKHLVLLLLLIVAALVLSGCGVPRTGVENFREAEPSGWWQTIVVWPLAHILVWLNDFLVGIGFGANSWGFAIILFTAAIKVLTLPLTITQIRGMQAQRELQPKIQALQKKYGKDREKLSQEQMKLYQEAGVNPLSGCLPLLVQMPILFGLYSAIVALGNELQGAPFFWIPDLAFPRYTEGMSWISTSFRAGEYYILFAYLLLPALLVVTQFIMQKWMTPATPDTGGAGAGMTKQLGLMMTFMFGFFTLQVPAALTLYWVTSNLLQMGQQWFITSRMTSGSEETETVSDKAPSDMVVEGVTVEATESAAATAAGANGSGPSATTKPKKRSKRRRSKRR
jgi:YidC/Oxa1 family membrane protein insertase